MSDSTGWKPLLLLPLLVVAIVIERGIKLPDITGGWLFIALAVLAVFAILKLFKRQPNKKYARPVARYLSEGKIEITGDLTHIQKNFHKVAGATAWTHISAGVWRVDLQSCDNAQTRYVVDAINLDETWY